MYSSTHCLVSSVLHRHHNDLSVCELAWLHRQLKLACNTTQPSGITVCHYLLSSLLLSCTLAHTVLYQQESDLRVCELAWLHRQLKLACNTTQPSGITVCHYLLSSLLLSCTLAHTVLYQQESDLRVCELAWLHRQLELACNTTQPSGITVCHYIFSCLQLPYQGFLAGKPQYMLACTTCLSARRTSQSLCTDLASLNLFWKRHSHHV